MESAHLPPNQSMTTLSSTVKRRNFPSKLHTLLQQIELEGRNDIISWRPHGRAFLVRNEREFEQRVLPRFFRHSRLSSFNRQLSIYEFKRIACGQDKNAYYHPYFIRDRPELVSQIKRVATKANDNRHRTNDCIDPPNFYIEEISSRDHSDSTNAPVPHSNVDNVTNSTATVSSVDLLQQILSSIPQQTSVADLLLRIQMHNIISGNVQHLNADAVNYLSNVSMHSTPRMLGSTTLSLPSPSNQVDQHLSSGIQLHTQVLSRLILNQLSSSAIATPYQGAAASLSLVNDALEAIRSGALDAVIGGGTNQQHQQHYSNEYGNIVHNSNNNSNRSNTRDFLTTLARGSVQNNMQRANTNTNTENNHTWMDHTLRSLLNNVQNENIMSNMTNHINWNDTIQNRIVIPTMNLHNPSLPNIQLLPISEMNSIQRHTDNTNEDGKFN